MSASFSDAHVARTCCAHMLRAHVAHMFRNIPRGVGAEVVVQPALCMEGLLLHYIGPATPVHPLAQACITCAVLGLHMSCTCCATTQHPKYGVPDWAITS